MKNQWKETPVGDNISRYESPSLDRLAFEMCFGGIPNASMFWDKDNQQLIIKFYEDGKKFAYRKYKKKWYPFPDKK